MENNRRGKAINELVGEFCSYDMDDDVIIKWRSPEGKQPSESDIDAKVVELEAEYDALAWSRNSQNEYPTIEELTVALYDTDDKAALETKRAAVKTKWPKDNSGPV